MFDLVIRGGLVFDGAGGPPFVADVAVDNGNIAAVGDISGRGREEIDATDKMVTPGFIDVHTHYDGQLIWSERVSPSSSHGVTTVVTGNCGVGFAPCRPTDRGRLMQLLEGVEDMPEIVLADGLTWDWETFPEYVEALRRRSHDIDFAVQVPHAALRVYVMGERAADGAMATDEDLVQMRAIMRDAIQAGALGVGTSRSIYHTTVDGRIIPTAHSPERELKVLADGMNDAGGGVIQAILDFHDPVSDLEMFDRIAAETATPFSFSLLQAPVPHKDNWRAVLLTMEKAIERGSPITAQVFPRPVGVLLGLETSCNPFSAYPSYKAIEHLPLSERVARLRDPQVRAAILSEQPDKGGVVFLSAARSYKRIYSLGSPPNYEPDPENSVAELARVQNRTPEEVVYDLLLEEEGRALLLMTASNYEDRNLEALRTMLTHPNTVPALGDGGAHYGIICDSTYTTFMLTYWGRDRQQGRIALPEIIRSMSSKPAAMLGLSDRGRIAPGLKADLNVIDFDKLALRAPTMVGDLPGGRNRLSQDADGYVATFVNGQAIYRDGKPTGALPGRMVAASRAAGG